MLRTTNEKQVKAVRLSSLLFQYFFRSSKPISFPKISGGVWIRIKLSPRRRQNIFETKMLKSLFECFLRRRCTWYIVEGKWQNFSRKNVYTGQAETAKRIFFSPSSFIASSHYTIFSCWSPGFNWRRIGFLLFSKFATTFFLNGRTKKREMCWYDIKYGSSNLNRLLSWLSLVLVPNK